MKVYAFHKGYLLVNACLIITLALASPIFAQQETILYEADTADYGIYGDDVITPSLD